MSFLEVDFILWGIICDFGVCLRFLVLFIIVEFLRVVGFIIKGKILRCFEFCIVEEVYSILLIEIMGR